MKKLTIDDELIYRILVLSLCMIGIIKAIFGLFEYMSFEMIFALLSLMLVMRLESTLRKRGNYDV